MSIGRVAEVLEVPLDQPWSYDIRFWLDAAKTQPLQLASGAGWMRRLGPGATTLALSLDNGRIVLNGGTLGVRVAQADLAGLQPGAWALEVQATDQTGAVRQVRAVLDLPTGLGS